MRQVVRVTNPLFDPNWDRRSVLRDLRRLWPVRRPSPLLLVWYWRYEGLLVIVLAAVGSWLIDLIGAWPTLSVLVVTASAIGMVPLTRNVAVRAFWHVVTPHRVRRGLVEAGIYSRKGRVPEILRVRSVPSGEVVSLWCFAGTSFAEISRGLGVIGTACYAQEMQALADPQYLHLVSLLVVRYPEAPLPPGDWPSKRGRQRDVDSDETFRPLSRRKGAGDGGSGRVVRAKGSSQPRQEQSLRPGEQ